MKVERRKAFQLWPSLLLVGSGEFFFAFWSLKLDINWAESEFRKSVDLKRESLGEKEGWGILLISASTSILLRLPHKLWPRKPQRGEPAPHTTEYTSSANWEEPSATQYSSGVGVMVWEGDGGQEIGSGW